MKEIFALSLSGWIIPLVVSSEGFLFAVMITTILSGQLVKMGKGFGKLKGSTKFQGFIVLWLCFLLEAVLLAVFFGYFESFVDNFLLINLKITPFITIEAIFGYYLWFCIEFNYVIPRFWKSILLAQALAIVNLLLIHFNVI